MVEKSQNFVRNVSQPKSINYSSETITVQIYFFSTHTTKNRNRSNNKKHKILRGERAVSYPKGINYSRKTVSKLSCTCFHSCATSQLCFPSIGPISNVLNRQGHKMNLNNVQLCSMRKKLKTPVSKPRNH